MASPKCSTVYVPDSDEEHTQQYFKRKSVNGLQQPGARKRIKSEAEMSAKQVVDTKILRDRKENCYAKSQANGASRLNSNLNPDISDSIAVIKTLEARIQELEAEKLTAVHKIDTLSKNCALRESEVAKIRKDTEENGLEKARLRYFADWLDDKEIRIEARESEVKDKEKRADKQRELIMEREKKLIMEQDAHEKKMEREHQRLEKEVNDAKQLQDVVSTCQILGQMIQYIGIYARHPERIVQRGNDILERRRRNNE